MIKLRLCNVLMSSSVEQVVKVYFVYGIQRPLGRPRRRWEDNIKMDLQEVECGVMESIDLVQDRGRWQALVNAVMNLQVS